MPLLITYVLKLSISLSVVYLFYHFVLQRMTFYNWNRWYLISYTILCFFIPFIDISFVLAHNNWSEANVVRWVPTIDNYQENIVATTNPANSFSSWNLISLVLITGMVIVFIRLLVQLFSFKKMMGKAQFISDEGMRIYQVDEKIIPFSFGNSIFINRNLHSENELQEIILHEFVHVKQRHSADIIWSEILCLFNWYNPFVWLIRKSIRQNLEFIADNKVLENGVDRKRYQYLLLKVIGNNHFSIAPKFNFSSLKKRIAMMNKIKSAKVNLLRFLFVLPLLAVVLVSFREQIGDSLYERNERQLLAPTPAPAVAIADTVPPVTTPNKKGYIINVVGVGGECTIVVKDKKGKEVKRILMNDWTGKHDEEYGEIPPPPPPDAPTPPVPLAKTMEPIDAIAPITGDEPKWTSICKEFEITENKAVMHLHLNDGTVEEYDLTNADQKKKFEQKYGHVIPVKPLHPPEGLHAGVSNAISGQTVIAPMAPVAGVGEVMIIDDYSYTITGNEDIVITISKKSSRQDLEDFKKQMKAKGVELKFDEIEYNSKGELTTLTGTMRSGDGNSNFVAIDFSKLILGMIKKGDRTYFKVSTKYNKAVI